MADLQRCPFCGLIIRRDDAARRIDHEVPVCERFTRMCADADRVSGPHVIELDELELAKTRR